MKFNNITDVEEFIRIVDGCRGEVYLTSQYGDKFNLKSKLSQYVALGLLIGEHGSELELWCDDKEDEAKVMEYLTKHPEVMA